VIWMDRRSVLVGSAALAATAVAPRLARAAQPGVAIFIMDARFEQSLLAARRWERHGAAVLDPRETDLGLAWHRTIPERIRNGGIAGLTLWSDMFICETLARQAGLRAVGPHVPVGRDLFQWSLA
jgi:hypothetical protein